MKDYVYWIEYIKEIVAKEKLTIRETINRLIKNKVELEEETYELVSNENIENDKKFRALKTYNNKCDIYLGSKLIKKNLEQYEEVEYKDYKIFFVFVTNDYKQLIKPSIDVLKKVTKKRLLYKHEDFKYIIRVAFNLDNSPSCTAIEQLLLGSIDDEVFINLCKNCKV